MGEHLIVVDVDGTIYGMWSDDLLGIYEVEHGQVEVKRASHVEFDNMTQSWRVYEVDGVSLMLREEFTTRQAALEAEAFEIQWRLLGGE